MNRLLILTALLAMAQGVWAQQTSTPNCPINACPDKYLPTKPIDPPRTEKEAINRILGSADTAGKEEEKTRRALLDAEKEYAEAKNSKLSDRAIAAIRDIAAKKKKLRDAAAELSRDPADAAAAAYLKAKSDSEAATANRKALYQQAIDETRRAYHLTPPVLDPANDPRFPANLTKLPPWNPTYEERHIWDSNVGAVVQRTDEEVAESLRILNNVRKSEDRPPIDPTSGHTVSATGKIEIYGPAAASPEGPADYLASIILHETRHWADLVARGGLRRNENDVTSYESFLSDEKAYALQADFLEKTLKYPKKSALVSDTRAKSDRYKERAEQLDRDGTKHWYMEDLRRDPRYKNWPEVQIPGDAAAPGQGDLGNLERMRAVADHDFLGSYLDQATPVLTEAKRLGDAQAQERRKQDQIERERLQRDWDEKRRQAEELEARSFTVEKAAEAAHDCGFKIWKSDQGFEIGTSVNYGEFGEIRYGIPEAPDMDQLRIGIVLLNKCLSAAFNERSGSDSPLCADITDRFNQRWSEPGFRDHLPLRDFYIEHGPLKPGPADCLRAMATDLKAPLDTGSLNGIAAKTGKKWRKAYQREVDWFRNKPPMHNPDPDPPRRGSGGTPGGGGEGGYRCPEDCQCVSLPWTCKRPASPL